MAERCTWMGEQGRCEAIATHPEVAKDGSQWANLCDEHFEEVERALTNFDARKLLANWVRAQGGPKAAAARIRL